MRKHQLSRKHILLLNSQVFGWLHSEMGIDEKKCVCKEESLIPLPYCFQRLLILFSLLALVNKTFRIFWYLIWYQCSNMSFENMLISFGQKSRMLDKQCIHMLHGKLIGENNGSEFNNYSRLPLQIQGTRPSYDFVISQQMDQSTDSYVWKIDFIHVLTFLINLFMIQLTFTEHLLPLSAALDALE